MKMTQVTKVVGVLLLFSLMAVTEPNPLDSVVEMPRETILWRYTTAKLTCRFRGSTPRAVYWMKGSTVSNSNILLYLYDGDVRGTGYEQGRLDMDSERSLLIHNVSVQDEGRWWCRISNAGGELVHNSTLVTVAAAPFAPYPTIVSCQEGNTMTVGNTRFCNLQLTSNITAVYLTCRVWGFRPAINLDWWNGTQIIPSSYSVTANVLDGQLQDIEVTMMATIPPREQRFTCIATGVAVGSGQSGASITIYSRNLILTSTHTAVPVAASPSSTSQSAAAGEKLGYLGLLSIIPIIIIILVIVDSLRKRSCRYKSELYSKAVTDEEISSLAKKLPSSAFLAVGLKYGENHTELRETFSGQKSEQSERKQFENMLRRWRKNTPYFRGRMYDVLVNAGYREEASALVQEQDILEDDATMKFAESHYGEERRALKN